MKTARDYRHGNKEKPLFCFELDNILVIRKTLSWESDPPAKIAGWKGDTNYV